MSSQTAVIKPAQPSAADTPWGRAELAVLEMEKAMAAMAVLQLRMKGASEANHAHMEAHADAVKAYEETRAQVEAVEGRVREVHKIIERYAGVQDPVTADDGFTYERRTILAYVQECRDKGVPALSNQGSVELTSDVYTNSTLRRITDQLKAIRLPGDPVPAAAPAPAAAAVPAAPATPAVMPGAPAVPAGAPPAFGVRAPYVPGGPYSGAIGASNFNARARQSMPKTLSGQMHPCIRVYGSCNFGDTCTWAKFPYECCLSHLKGRCRYGAGCHEPHVMMSTPPGSTHNSGANQMLPPPPPQQPNQYW